MLSVFKSVPLRYMGLDWLSNGVSISEAPVPKKSPQHLGSVAGEFRPRHLQRSRWLLVYDPPGNLASLNHGDLQDQGGQENPMVFRRMSHFRGCWNRWRGSFPSCMVLLRVCACWKWAGGETNLIQFSIRWWLWPDYMKSYDPSAEFWLEQLQPRPGHDRWTSFMGLRQLLPNSVAHSSLVESSFTDYMPFSVTLFQMIILCRLLFMQYRFVAWIKRSNQLPFFKSCSKIYFNLAGVPLEGHFSVPLTRFHSNCLQALVQTLLFLQIV